MDNFLGFSGFELCLLSAVEIGQKEREWGMISFVKRVKNAISSFILMKNTVGLWDENEFTSIMKIFYPSQGGIFEIFLYFKVF